MNKGPQVHFLAVRDIPDIGHTLGDVLAYVDLAVGAFWRQQPALPDRLQGLNR